MEKKVIEVKDLGTTLEYYPEVEGVREVFGVETDSIVPKILKMVRDTGTKTESVVKALESGELSLQELVYLASLGVGVVGDDAIELLGPAVAGTILDVSAAKEKMAKEGLSFLIPALEEALSSQENTSVEEGS